MNKYVLLKPHVNAQAFEAKIKNLVSKYGQKVVQETGFNATLQLRPVRDIYLHSGKSTAGGEIGNIRTVYLFATIGVFILLLACLNFINLSTARAVERAKEVGIKKVLGSGKNQLVRQFLTEAAVLCTGAALISLVVTTVALPLFNQFAGKNFTVGDLLSTESLLLLTVILAVLIPLTGFYPAWVLSNYQPISVLKGSFVHSVRGILLRKSLVVVQFAVSVCLIISTLVVWQQLRFMQNQSLGFDKDRVIVVDAGEVPYRLRQQQATAFKKELNNQSLVISVTAATAVPGRTGWEGQFAYGEGSTQSKGILVEHIPVDYDYVKTMGLQVITGRDFIADGKADSVQSYLINGTAAKAFGWETPEKAIGKKLAASGMNGQVIGVLKDYHQHGLQEAIRPVVLNVAPYINVFALRYKGNDAAEAVSQLKNTWQKLFPGYPLDYRFMDDDFQQQYAKEQKLTNAFTLAAALAIVIACLGLFGLATYAVETRTKEIGIRKVLGASVSQIAALLSKDFLKLVLIAFVIASPVAWYAMHQWLQDFAYRVGISWWIFASAGVLALLIALFTVSFQAIRAALANPVKSLRSE
jgi:putative ABC transport system permease protein